MIGEQILNYRILAKLGEGGMGTVYLAEHIQLARRAAIKALHVNLVNNAQIRARFKNEAATMAHLKHPQIVSLYDYLETAQGLYLIMEYVEGKPLDEYIEKVSGPIPENRALRLFVKILDGFEYAHNQGVVHRDIKPSNLIITPDEEVKILDFGIAKLRDASSKSLTQAGTRMGTVLYMSPEQVKGQEVDRRSDVYALGITLFQMLTGKTPYDHAQATEYEVYDQIVNHLLPRAKHFYPNVSERMQSIIDRATAKNPKDRFQSCGEFKQILLAQSVLTSPSEMNDLSQKTSFPQNQPTSSEPTYRKKTRRRSYLWTALTVLVLLTGATLFVILNPFDFRILRPYQIIEPDYSEQETLLRKRVLNFYQTVETHDFDQLRSFYQDSLENYFGNENRSLAPDLKAAYRIYWDKYTGERHEIDWDTFDYTQDEAGNHIVVFSMKYYYRTEEAADWKNLRTTTEIRLDPDLKIYYIDRVRS